MKIENLKIAYKKACTAERLLYEVKHLVTENGDIQGPMYIIHDILNKADSLISVIKQAYADTIED